MAINKDLVVSVKDTVERLGYEGLTLASQCSVAKKLFLGLEKSEKLTQAQKDEDSVKATDISKYLVSVAIGGAKDEVKAIAKEILAEIGFEGDLEEIRKEKNRVAKKRNLEAQKEKLANAEEMEVSRNFYLKQLNKFAEALRGAETIEDFKRIKRKAKDIHKPFDLE